MRAAYLARAIELVNWLAGRGTSFTLADYMDACGVHRRTAYRELAALEAAGWVEKVNHGNQRAFDAGDYDPGRWRSLIRGQVSFRVTSPVTTTHYGDAA